MGEDEEGKVERAYRVRCAVIEMLKERGYEMGELIKMTLDEFRYRHSNHESGELNYESMDFKMTGLHETDHRELNVRWIGTSEPLDALAMFRHCRHLLINSHTIFITRQGITGAAARRCLKELNQTCAVEFFTEDELLDGAGRLFSGATSCVNHAICTQPTTQVLKAYEIQVGDMPSIRIDSPLARYYGLRKGELLMTTQYLPTAAYIVTYRLGV